MLSADQIRRISVIDSHTGGEPTRTVVAGGPGLGRGPLAERLERLRGEHDWLRAFLINELRGQEHAVGALLVEPEDPDHRAAVIFFNDEGYLRMCGHGLIGVVTSLAWLGRIGPGEHRFETVAGSVTAELHTDGAVTFRNVPCRRTMRSVKVELPGGGTVTGDVAWGGNWFFLCADHGRELRRENIPELSALCAGIRAALEASGVTGEGGALIDHIELFGPPSDPAVADARSFVLCPGAAYDRSPCGTGTSAKVACLAADGKLSPGEVWRQESIVGSVFRATYAFAAAPAGGGAGEGGERAVIPAITGRAHVTAEAVIIGDPTDELADPAARRQFADGAAGAGGGVAGA